MVRQSDPRAAYARAKAEQNVVLLDVRTPEEYEAVHAFGVRLLPLDQLSEAKAQDIIGPKTTPVMVLCHSGARAMSATGELERLGFTDVTCVAGGTEAWIAADLPVERGEKKGLSIEAQTRIVIGLMVLTGVGLGLMNPWFLIIAAVPGLGLIMAGLTGACPLAAIIAKLPWNCSTGCCGGSSCGCKV